MLFTHTDFICGANTEPVATFTIIFAHRTHWPDPHKLSVTKILEGGDSHTALSPSLAAVQHRFRCVVAHRGEGDGCVTVTVTYDVCDHGPRWSCQREAGCRPMSWV